MIRELGVVLPARDERDLLPRALDAVLRSRDALHDAVDVRVVVVLDSCTDDSAAVVARYPDVEAVTVGAGRVGVARAVGAQRVLGGRDPASVWLANTDADSAVPSGWLATMVQEAGRGAHVLLGTVVPDAGLRREQLARWRARHVLRENHPHVHGANFGIRGDAYLALGGWPDRASGEDQELAALAVRAGSLHIVRTARSPVRTSARLEGRAPAGFSSYLRGLQAVCSLDS